MIVLRHLFAIAVLPFTVTVLIPVAIARGAEVSLRAPEGAIGTVAVALGCAFLGLGAALFASSLHHFAVLGRGTLAPWDPPRTLVVSGLYRHVRNPMISGVVFVLLGEALVLRSWAHALWALVFFAGNAIYIPLAEEPDLEKRFGDPYRIYKRHVPRLVPRLRPWTPGPDTDSQARPLTTGGDS